MARMRMSVGLSLYKAPCVDASRSCMSIMPRLEGSRSMLLASAMFPTPFRMMRLMSTGAPPAMAHLKTVSSVSPLSSNTFQSSSPIRAIVALVWGSRSTTSVFLPWTPDSMVATPTVVVVLPTPPFRLITAIFFAIVYNLPWRCGGSCLFGLCVIVTCREPPECDG